MTHPNVDNVIFQNPITGRIEQMPVAMVNAYIAHAEHLHLEEAARVAAICDDEEATNLILSIVLDQYDADYQKVITPPEGASYDRLSVETPSLR